MALLKGNEHCELKKRAHLKNHERFPRLFKEAVRILKQVKGGECSIKTALYSKRLPGQCLKKIYGMTCGVIDNLQLIDQIIEKVGLIRKIPHLPQESIEVMVYELTLKKHCLPGESKPIQMIRKYEAAIHEAYEECSQGNTENSAQNISTNPKYIRVNILKFSVSQVIDILTEAGFCQHDVKPETSMKQYRKILRDLKEKEFVQDIHFSNILVFSHKQNVAADFPLRHCIHMFIQDKSSYIAAAALNPPKDSIVLDCCAAPGMKTVHLSSIMENSGKIYAVDKNETRLSSLRSILYTSGAENCQVIHKDFTKLDPTSYPYSKVEYILLDPSCSGSGMINRIGIDHPEYSETEERIEKLGRFQITLLKHAMSFPSVKRIVYSTCSVHDGENEYVVDEALKMYSEKFKVVETLPDLHWKPRGSKEFVFGKLCLRASPKKNLTNGFFVTVLERLSSTQ